MIELKKAMEITGTSLGELADLLHCSKATVSKVKDHDYPNWEAWEKKAIEAMVRAGKLTQEQAQLLPEYQRSRIEIDDTKFVRTNNVMALDALAADLLNPRSTLNASIGVCTGKAGYGKTTTIKHFCAANDRATYILYMDGYSIAGLMRDALRSMTGETRRSFVDIKDAIKDASAVYRKLLVVDEADRMPVRLLEALRGLNEYCGLPILLIGEPALLTKIHTEPRLESRMRKPRVEFAPLSCVDIVMYWKEAIDLDLTGKAEIQQILLKHCHGDFRIMVNDAQRIVQYMNTNDLTEVDIKVVRDGIR
ncbi:MAG: ATP-binding protein [Spirochaetales bacterium]|nr:ATP-binding protein [Spirochaetales bacterium]MBR5098998.1 ATP-binding protein [Spirochaetales bacterium]